MPERDVREDRKVGMKSDGTKTAGSMAKFGSREWYFRAEAAMYQYLTPLIGLLGGDFQIHVLSLVDSVLKHNQYKQDPQGNSLYGVADINRTVHVSRTIVAELLSERVEWDVLYPYVRSLGAVLTILRPDAVCELLKACYGSSVVDLMDDFDLRGVAGGDTGTLSLVSIALTIGAFLAESEMRDRGLVSNDESNPRRIGQQYVLGQIARTSKHFEEGEDQEVGRIVAKCCSEAPRFVMGFMSGVYLAHSEMPLEYQKALGEGKSGDLLGHILVKTFSRTPTPALLKLTLGLFK